MVHLIRRFQHPLLVTITVLTIVSFIYLFNAKQGYGRGGDQPVAIVYGKPLSMSSIDHGRNLFKLANDLQLFELIEGVLGRQTLMGMMFRQISEYQGATEFSLNNIVLRHEADKMGVISNQDDIYNGIQKITAFQTNGAFDSTKYATFVNTDLGPLGFSATQIEEAVRDQLAVAKLKELIGGLVQPTAAEIHDVYVDRNQKTDLSVIRWNLEDFKKKVQLTDEELHKLYDERKDTLKTPEKRKVKIASFVLDDKNPPADRAKALQELGEKASNFTAAMAEKGANFDEVAAKFVATVTETASFALATPPPELDPTAAAAAFALKTEQPNSDALAAAKQNGYIALQLTGTEEAKPLTFEESKAQLSEQLTKERAQEALNLATSKAHNDIEAALKAGKTFEDAAKESGVTPEKFPTFSKTDRNAQAPDANAVISASADVAEGQISAFTPSDTGGFILHVDKRQPIDEAEFAKKKDEIAKQLASTQGDAVFESWFSQKKKEANAQFGRQ